MALSSCSLLSVLSYCCLAVLMAVLGARLYTFVMVKSGKAQPGEDHLAQVCGASWCLSEDRVGEVSSVLAQGLNNLLPRARSLFLIHNSVTIASSFSFLELRFFLLPSSSLPHSLKPLAHIKGP